MAEHPKYMPLPLDGLGIDGTIDCQLYVKAGSEQYVKYRDPGLAFDSQTRDRLRENGHQAVYVRLEDAAMVNGYLEANMSFALQSSSLSTEKKAQVFYNTTVHLVREVMLNPSSPEQVKLCRKAVESSVQHFLSHPKSLAKVMELSSADYYTYTHSTNVMAYSVALGKYLNFPDGNELVELGESAILHDVGKSYIDWNITNKGGPLNQDEFEIMKQHSDLGFQALSSTKEVPDHVLYAVRHHHEKIDGSGYPHGLTGNQVDLPVRVIALSDIYDALTTRRVYRGAIRSYPALQMIKDKVGTEIDERVFGAFVKMLGEQ